MTYFLLVQNFFFINVCILDAYTTDDIKYEWKKENPIQQKKGLEQSLPSFELQDVLTDYCTSNTNTGLFIFNQKNKIKNYIYTIVHLISFFK